MGEKEQSSDTNCLVDVFVGVCGHSYMQSKAIFSVKKEAKSPAEKKDGKEALKIGGKKCEMTQEIRKVKELRNVREFSHLWRETTHLSHQDVR